jgi:hypothetical protein
MSLHSDLDGLDIIKKIFLLFFRKAADLEPALGLMKGQQ